jgi:GGDEF domain-containing protein
MKLEDVLSIATGETVAARVIQSLNEPFTIKGRPVTTSASVGISISDSDGVKHPEELLKEADDAMHGAKGSGKGRYKASRSAPLAAT